jgi:hypothetical protein
MTLEPQVDLHDREIEAIRKLILTGMKMLNRTHERSNRLVTAQRETRRATQIVTRRRPPLVNTLRRGTNGHTKRKLDHE